MADPVLLIHGIMDSGRKMERLARHLRAVGREAHTLTLAPSWGQLGLDALAQQLSDFVEKTFAAGQRFDLIGFSMGGLVCRFYLQRLGGLARVRRFVSISAPHQGSLLAWLIPNAGCRQMRPGSDFLRDLARDADRLAEVGHVSFWTPFDLTIVPATSSVIRAGSMRRLWAMAHPLMVWHRHCLHAVEAALAE